MVMQDHINAHPIQLGGNIPVGSRLRSPVVGVLVLAMAIGFQPEKAQARGWGLAGVGAAIVGGALLGGILSRRARAHAYAPRHVATPHRVIVRSRGESETAVVHHRTRNRSRDAEPETTKASVNSGDAKATGANSGLSGVNAAPPQNDLLNKGNLVVPPSDAVTNRALPPAGSVASPMKAPPEPGVGAAPPIASTPSPVAVAPAPSAAAATPGSGDLH